MNVVVVKVGMADLNIVQAPGILRTLGLGSCVGVALYDPLAKLAGMAHIMLPSSGIAKEGSIHTAKYADTAIPELIRRLREAGSSVHRLEAKLAGGAQMFSFTSGGDTMRIGPRNVESCREVLRRQGIPIKAEDTGGNYGRTIELDSATGIFTVRSVQHGVKEW